MGSVIEKPFEGGRVDLQAPGMPVVSLAVGVDMSDGQINSAC
ncbi:MAG: hypothetical protein PVF04_04160 [Anaerolineae bacterium]|jgi:hypothetical protein